MKYCKNCGTEIEDDANFCPHCGVKQEQLDKEVIDNNDQRTSDIRQPDKKYGNDAYALVVKIFLIIGTVSSASLLIPLAWTLPLTITTWNKLDRGEPISTALKVVDLIFVSLIAGIFLLIRDEVDNN